MIEAGLQIFLRAPITPRAGVTIDHGPLVLNPLNNDQGEQIFAMSDARCGADSQEKSMNQTTIDAGRFDVAQIAATLPETATTLLVDHYLTNREAASARVFRVYKPTPPHYHATCDEYLYVFSGRGTFWMEGESTVTEFGAGELLFFKRGTVHAQPKILEDPVVFLSIDTPRRDPKDIVFVNPEDGTPESFIRSNQ
jgi:mannose-6-phosphate isomerase-like protein (cupin superfamily)